VAFAKASGGVFQDPMGKDFATLDEAVAYARVEAQPESEEHKAEMAAKRKARQDHMEAVLREGERADRQKVEEGNACPNCGFSCGWNGRECNHCRFRNPVG
jgi:hypothetical protein